MTTTVVHLRSLGAGPCSTYVGRGVRRSADPRGRIGHPLANPFAIRPDRPRPETLALYRMWLLEDRSRILRAFALAGHQLGCWCAPRNAELTGTDPWVCHAQIIAAVADHTDVGVHLIDWAAA